MNSKEFYDTVVKLREAQRSYFKTRSSIDLQRSKQLEKIIDSEIDRVSLLINKKTNSQQSLFD